MRKCQMPYISIRVVEGPDGGNAKETTAKQSKQYSILDINNTTTFGERKLHTHTHIHIREHQYLHTIIRAVKIWG